MLAGELAPGKASHAREVKSLGQTKCSPWSYRLEFVRVADDTTIT